MAKKSTKGLRDVPTPKIVRNYDIFSIEKRLHDLETNGGGGTDTAWDYSESEIDTKQKWIDGKEIYCKVYVPSESTSLGSNAWTPVTIPDITIKTLIDCRINFTNSYDASHKGGFVSANTQRTDTGISYYQTAVNGTLNFIILFYTKE